MKNQLNRMEQILVTMNKRVEEMSKRMESHENMTVQLITMVADVKREAERIKHDIEFTFKENAMTRLEVERLKHGDHRD